MNKQILILAISFLFHIGAKAQEITIGNWNEHTEIIEIRALYANVQKGMTEGWLDTYNRKVEERGDYVFSKTVRINRKFRIRMYAKHQSDETATFNAEAYYDLNNKLRFCYFVTEMNGNGTEDGKQHKKELRIYFNETNSKPIWIIQSYDGKQIALGTNVDISDYMKIGDYTQPYVEFHTSK